MTTVVKSKALIVVPSAIQRRAGIKVGDHLDFKVSGGIISILPKLPATDDEYTPEQRRQLDAALAEGLEDVKKGRLHGPFETHEEMIAFLHGRARKAARKTSPRKKR